MTNSDSNVSRREFLARAIATASLLTAPQLFAACATSNRREMSQVAAQWQDFPVAQAAAIAMTAPNPHNAQPWKIRFDSPLSLTLFVDESRLLPETDPPARQIHIGQGTFLELLRLAALDAGYRADIRLFPQGRYALGEIGKKPVAQLNLRAEADLPRDAIFAHWGARATNRTEYEGPAISEQEFLELQKLTNPRAGKLVFLTGEDLAAANDSVYRAMETEMHDPGCADESYRWFRLSDAEIREKADGINLRGNGMSGFKLWMVRTFFVSADKDSVNSESSTKSYLESFRTVAQSSRGIVLFVTPGNTQNDWVECGMDYLRFHLAATSLGLAMQPVSQVLQEYDKMKSLRVEFEQRMGVKPPAKIQMMVRLGRSDYRYFAPRRPLQKITVS